MTLGRKMHDGLQEEQAGKDGWSAACKAEKMGGVRSEGNQEQVYRPGVKALGSFSKLDEKVLQGSE